MRIALALVVLAGVGAWSAPITSCGGCEDDLRIDLSVDGLQGADCEVALQSASRALVATCGATSDAGVPEAGLPDAGGGACPSDAAGARSVVTSGPAVGITRSDRCVDMAITGSDATALHAYLGADAFTVSVTCAGRSVIEQEPAQFSCPK